MKLVCPVCRSQFENGRTEQCPQCQTPLRSYSKLQNHQANLFNLGLAAAKEKKFAQACEYFGAVVHWYPTDINARNALAMACYELGDFERAKFHLETVLDRSPHDEQAKRGIATIDKKKATSKKKSTHKKASRKRKKKGKNRAKH